MLANLDPKTKSLLLNKFKEDAEKHRMQKKLAKEAKIKEEREFLQKNLEKEQQMELYEKQAKIQKQRERKKEIDDMLRQK